MTLSTPTPRLDAETSAYLAEMGDQLAQLSDADEAALLAGTALAEVSFALGSSPCRDHQQLWLTGETCGQDRHELIKVLCKCVRASSQTRRSIVDLQSSNTTITSANVHIATSAQLAGKEVTAAGDPKASRFLEKVLATSQPEATLAFVDGILGGADVGGVPPFVAIATRCGYNYTRGTYRTAAIKSCSQQRVGTTHKRQLVGFARWQHYPLTRLQGLAPRRAHGLRSWHAVSSTALLGRTWRSTCSGRWRRRRPEGTIRCTAVCTT